MHRICAILCAVVATAMAQSITETDMVSAAKFREKLASDVASGTVKPAPALAKLHGTKDGGNLTGDNEEDFALAASDVGRRLAARDKRAEAEEFFRAADTALTSVIATRKDKDKVRVLTARALLRVQFLGDPEGAKKDIQEALALSPDDPMLTAVARNVERGHGKKDPAPPVQFKDKPWERRN